MTPSGLFSPRAARTSRPWLTWVGVAIACLVGALLMSQFVDAVHLSMAHGEALRLTQRMSGLTDATTGQHERIARLGLAHADR